MGLASAMECSQCETIRGSTVGTRFIILDHYATRFESFRRDTTEWTTKGQVKLREDLVEGLANAPAAFIGMPAASRDSWEGLNQKARVGVCFRPNAEVGRRTGERFAY